MGILYAHKPWYGGIYLWRNLRGSMSNLFCSSTNLILFNPKYLLYDSPYPVSKTGM